MTNRTTAADKVALITGANIGIGKNIARQLALRGDFIKIYLACRNSTRAAVAAADLRTLTRRDLFEVIVMDMSDVVSIRNAISNICQPIDWLFMNAGGVGGDDYAQVTSCGVTNTFGLNIFGHAVLLEGLIQAKLLTCGGVLAGSEASRGVAALGIKKPVWQSQSVDEFVSVIDGSAYKRKKVDIMYAYAQVKHIGALYMSAMARRYPELKLITVSPGNTQGTDAPNKLPTMTRLFVKYVANPVIFPLTGMSHSLDVGTKRLVDGVDNKSLKSGAYYASKKGLTGAVVDQSIEFPEYGSQLYQDHAYEAVHRFM